MSLDAGINFGYQSRVRWCMGGFGDVTGEEWGGIFRSGFRFCVHSSSGVQVDFVGFPAYLQWVFKRACRGTREQISLDVVEEGHREG